MEKRTHILREYPSGPGGYLFRAEDGIAIASWKECTVVFGEEPNKKSSRVFIDPDHARAWLLGKVAADDLTLRGLVGVPEVEVQNVESTIALPGDMVQLPGSLSKFN